MAEPYIERHVPELEASLTRALNEISRSQPSDPVTALALSLLQSRQAGSSSDAAQIRRMASEDEVPHASEKWNLFSWVQGAGVHRIIAGALRHALSQAGLGDDPDAMLGFLRALKDREDLAKLLHSSSMLEALVDLMWGEVETLQRAGAATSTELQSKFAGSVELSYQGLDSFFGGLEGIVGPPNPMLLLTKSTRRSS